MQVQHNVFPITDVSVFVFLIRFKKKKKSTLISLQLHLKLQSGALSRVPQLNSGSWLNKLLYVLVYVLLIALITFLCWF